MYITPSGTVRLLTGIPLDSTYVHTIYFATEQDQIDYFTDRTKLSGSKYMLFTQQSYQRHTRNYIRLEVCADDIYDCNYMMFQNTAFGTKWFYAFIDDIEYVNNITAEITYTIDDLQTWFFDYELEESWVEREHSSTDVVGDNLIAENINLGTYFNDNEIGTGFFDEWVPVILTPYMVEQKTAFGDVGAGVQFWGPVTTGMGTLPDSSMITGNPSGLHAIACMSSTHTTQANCDLLDEILLGFNAYGKIDSIASVYFVPRHFIDTTSTGYVYLDKEQRNMPNRIKTFATKPTTLGSYGVPRNKKLLTYPFNFFTIETFDGDSYDYCYEFFSDANIQFRIDCTLTASPSFKAIPYGYKNRTANQINMNESVTMNKLPIASYATNAFMNWLGQNKTAMVLNMMTGAFSSAPLLGKGLGHISAGEQMLTPKTQQLSKRGAEMMARGYSEIGRGAAYGTLGAIKQNMSAIAAHINLPNMPKGSIDGSVEVANGTKDIHYIHKYVSPQIAASIDDYFDMYGYATHRVKVPNINVRPHWCYTKTLGCNIRPKPTKGLPNSAIENICSIYDNGITFWKNGNEVGDYSLNNAV